jgi:hypothetical protein
MKFRQELIAYFWYDTDLTEKEKTGEGGAQKVDLISLLTKI